MNIRGSVRTSSHNGSPTRESDSKSLLRTQQLRSTIAAPHEAVESTEISQQLAHGSVSRAAYCCLHARLYVIHDAIDAQFRANDHLSPFLDAEDLRAEQVRQDLLTFDALSAVEEIGRDLTIGMSPTEWLAKRITSSADKLWTCQLGYLYVIKGARFGGKVLAKPLSDALDIPEKSGEGISYYVAGKEVLPRQWRTFKRRVDQLNLSTANEQALFRGAKELISGFLAVYRSVSAGLTESSARPDSCATTGSTAP